jgi:hypothetical protein
VINNTRINKENYSTLFHCNENVCVEYEKLKIRFSASNFDPYNIHDWGEYNYSFDNI